MDWIAGSGTRRSLCEVATCVLFSWLVAIEEVKRQKKLRLRSMNSLMPSSLLPLWVLVLVE